MSGEKIPYKGKLSRTKPQVINIHENKVIVPLFKEVLNEDYQRVLDSIESKHGKSRITGFIYASISEVNNIIKLQYPCNKTPAITWHDVIKIHLPKWLRASTGSIYANLTRPRVNEILREFFLFIPSIYYRVHESNKNTYGFDFEPITQTPDYNIQDYSYYRLKEELQSQVIRKLFAIRIITHTYNGQGAHTEQKSSV